VFVTPPKGRRIGIRVDTVYNQVVPPGLGLDDLLGTEVMAVVIGGLEVLKFGMMGRILSGRDYGRQGAGGSALFQARIFYDVNTFYTMYIITFLMANLVVGQVEEKTIKIPVRPSTILKQPHLT
jgi:hypothetical protein